MLMNSPFRVPRTARSRRGPGNLTSLLGQDPSRLHVWGRCDPLVRNEGVIPVNSRPLRTHRLRKRSWALAGALLSATECWAMDGQNASGPSTRTSETVSATSDKMTTNGKTSRPHIPPPRRYQASDFQAQASLNAQGQPKSSPPKQVATEHGDQQPLFVPARVADGARGTVPLFGPAADNQPVASGSVAVSQSSAENPACAAVPASEPAPSTASIAPPPRFSESPVGGPATADAPPVGQTVRAGRRTSGGEASRSGAEP